MEVWTDQPRPGPDCLSQVTSHASHIITLPGCDSLCVCDSLQDCDHQDHQDHHHTITQSGQCVSERGSALPGASGKEICCYVSVAETPLRGAVRAEQLSEIQRAKQYVVTMSGNTCDA